jgi:hypothetical protein
VPNNPQAYSLQTDTDDAVRERLRALVAQTSAISHDLNNMVGTMLAYGVLMLDDTSADDPNHDFLKRLVEAGTEAKRLIAQLADSSPAEPGRERASASKAA